MNFMRKYPKVFKVNSKPNFISKIPNYTETNQANRAAKFFFNRNGRTENHSKLLRIG